jgi:hypothetical protein
MTLHVRTLILWGPRVLGLGLAAFLALFALDAFASGLRAAALPNFAIHLLPALIVGLLVAAGWRYPWVGAVGFGGLAVAYAAMASQRPDWILLISGPLALAAALFALSAASRR